MTPSAHREGLAATTLHPEVKPWQGMLIEAWITAILVTSIHGATNQQRKGALFIPTIPIGFAVALGIMSAVSAHTAKCRPNFVLAFKQQHLQMFSLKLNKYGYLSPI